MKKVIQFVKYRWLAITISLVLLAGGIAGTIIRGGFNFGIDFLAGLSMRVQIAPVAFELKYEGSGTAEVNLIGNALSIGLKTEESEVLHRYAFRDITTIADLKTEIETIEGFSLASGIAGTTETGQLISLNHAVDMHAGDSILVNYRDKGAVDYITIDRIRAAVSEVGNPQIQIIGTPSNQEFTIRIEDPGTDDAFNETMSKKVQESLSAAFGSENTIIKQVDYIGPRYSQSLGSQSIQLFLLALGIILVYTWFRFKLSNAVAAIIALLHDITIMFGFIGVFQIEFSTATIAAILTIFGYSLNDTIVVFDRIRENIDLMRDTKFNVVIDTSITQSLSRTLMTSGTTLMAIFMILFFGKGSVQIFALNMVLGIVVGTYSSIFIASPILLGWSNAAERRRKKKGGPPAHKIKEFNRAEIDEDAEPAASEKSSPANITEIPRIERKLKGKRQSRKK